MDWHIAPTFYERLTPRVIKQWAWPVWSGLHVTIGVVSFEIGSSKRYPLSWIGLVLIAALLPPTLALVRRGLLDSWRPLSTFVDLPEAALQRWVTDRTIAAVSGGWLMWCCGLINLSLAFLSLELLGVPVHRPAEALAALALAPLFFFCGTSMFTYVALLGLPYRVSKLPTRATYHNRYYGILGLNPFFFRLSLIALGFYLVLTTAVMLGPFPLASSMAVWLSAIGSAVLLAFPVSVWGLRQLLTDAKEDMLRPFAGVLDRQLQATMAEPSPANVSLLSSLLDVRQNLNNLPTWPVDFTTVLTLLSTVLFPILAIAIELWRGAK